MKLNMGLNVKQTKEDCFSFSVQQNNVVPDCNLLWTLKFCVDGKITGYSHGKRGPVEGVWKRFF